MILNTLIDTALDRFHKFEKRRFKKTESERELGLREIEKNANVKIGSED